MTMTTADLKNLMPTERKSMWRTAEERRMSDLTRVLEWLERRRDKKKLLLQKQKGKNEVTPGASEKADKKGAGTKKEGKNKKESVSKTGKEQGVSKNHGFAKYSWIYGLDLKNNQLPRPSIFSTLGPKRGSEVPDLDIKDAIALESTQRANPFRRQSSIDPLAQESMFNTRKVNLLREWSSKMPDSTYERKLKSLMEKGTEPKIETVKMLKPEEVLSCRYLRLSKNNIRTLVKLCKDAGLDVDIHPHMIEAEIDSKKVFGNSSGGT